MLLWPVRCALTVRSLCVLLAAGAVLTACAPAAAEASPDPSWTAGTVSPALSRDAALPQRVFGHHKRRTRPPDRPSTSRGFPDSTTTGVPAGTPLRLVTGDVVVTSAGAVLDGLDVMGCVTVKAPGVVLRRSRIRCNGPHPAVRLRDGGRDLLVQDTEIDGRGAVAVAVCCAGYTLQRVDIHSVIDGPRLGSATTVVDSWIHGLARAPGSHNDALQTTGASDVLVRGNRLDAWNPTTRDPFNAAVMLGTETAPLLDRVVIEDNYLNGGNFTVNFRKDGRYGTVTLRRNVFGRQHRYGPVLGVGPGISWASSNVYADTGEPVPVR